MARVPAGEEALYDEDLGEDEVAAELAPVTAQLAYVAERLGRRDEAVVGYEGVLALGLDDANTASVATNNMYAGLLAAATSATSRKVAGEAVKKLDAFMERSGGWRQAWAGVAGWASAGQGRAGQGHGWQDRAGQGMRPSVRCQGAGNQRFAAVHPAAGRLAC